MIFHFFSESKEIYTKIAHKAVIRILYALKIYISGSDTVTKEFEFSLTTKKEIKKCQGIYFPWYPPVIY
ncbi:hypothetical protein MSHOH_1487 [Methanosarcina horonobensis HB-1 = JCM 15518]|uniref:Uncharacterized protein n=1 Tax=Methanosarcina horonobensis HB-1 = JCM 15518 TaxID=1434110 RepID=A0A0E3WTJ5_9EURY|nr:hypothetical protein MSHOH_1487 [Methanosarcina horonobensis HB-1 = JCM 15518]